VSGKVENDRVILDASGVIPGALAIFVQSGTEVVEGAPFGDGVLCIGGALKPLAFKTASGGDATFPQAGDPAIRARSAALGDGIQPGTYRYYQVVYKDDDPGFCRRRATFNASNAVMVAW